MDSDLLLVLGMLVALLSLPALISAFASNSPMWRALFFAVVGGIMIVVAYQGKPDGYRAGDIPQVILEMIARVIR